MRNSWIDYICEIQEKPSLVLLNVGVRAAVPDTHRPALLWVGVYCRLNAGGAFWDEAETETLDRLEDHLLANLPSKLSATYVLRIATPGMREYFFYAPTPDGLTEAVALTGRTFAAYRIECDSILDCDWERYLTYHAYAETHHVAHPTKAYLASWIARIVSLTNSWFRNQ
jgi:hypothetical protein